MAVTSTIELLLFGPPTLRRVDTEKSVKLRPQIKSALAILVLEGTNLTISDERLIERLWWPDKTNARGSLNTLLDQIRALFEELDADVEHIQREDLRVKLGDIFVDTLAFDIARAGKDYDKALQIASRGPLIDGLSSNKTESFDWIERARGRYGAHVDWCYQETVNDLAKRIHNEKDLISDLIEMMDRRERSAVDYDLIDRIPGIRTALDQLRELAKETPLVLAPSPPASALSDPMATERLLNRLLVSRLGSGLSLRVDPDHVDAVHRYTRVVRHDLLDYPSGDFYSLRRLCGVNTTGKPSAGLVYAESSEARITFDQTDTRAYDTASRKRLVVESLLPSNVPLYQHGFRILFPRAIVPGEEFDITYAIRLPGELAVLSPVEEIMSIALVRWPHGVERLEFKVCLNFEPSSVCGEYLADDGELVQLDYTPSLGPYSPKEWYERDLDIAWSSEPHVISYSVDQPKADLYTIRYRLA